MLLSTNTSPNLFRACIERTSSASSAWTGIVEALLTLARQAARRRRTPALEALLDAGSSQRLEDFIARRSPLIRLWQAAMRDIAAAADIRAMPYVRAVPLFARYLHHIAAAATVGDIADEAEHHNMLASPDVLWAFFCHAASVL